MSSRLSLSSTALGASPHKGPCPTGLPQITPDPPIFPREESSSPPALARLSPAEDTDTAFSSMADLPAGHHQWWMQRHRGAPVPGTTPLHPRTEGKHPPEPRGGEDPPPLRTQILPPSLPVPPSPSTFQADPSSLASLRGWGSASAKTHPRGEHSPPVKRSQAAVGILYCFLASTGRHPLLPSSSPSGCAEDSSLLPGQSLGNGHGSDPVHPTTRARSFPAHPPPPPPAPRLRSPTSTCWQICISLAIWFSSSLLRLTRLVRFVSRVCCESRNGRGEREKRERSAKHNGVGLIVGLDDLRGLFQPMILRKPEDCPQPPVSSRDHLPPKTLPEGGTPSIRLGKGSWVSRQLLPTPEGRAGAKTGEPRARHHGGPEDVTNRW